ncbi:MAG: PorV/PorQ family protein [candidate division KSB1 bacterium]|nr:PorV/PorQ family protein [candidate division KSB1 bacterium]MDQ7064831.1 PorV/PorQ family protein [candidate division KSB1 bacterium]
MLIRRGYFAAILLLSGLVAFNANAQKKLAQTGFQFMSVGVDARATGMGEAFTTVEGTSAALFYNPSGMARIPTLLDVSLNKMKWIADIEYVSGALAFRPADGQYGVFGLSFLTVDYGEFLWTRVAPTEQGYEDIGGDWAMPTALAVGFGYSKELTDRFVVGGQIKYVYQRLGKSLVPIYTETDTLIEEQDYDLSVFAFDFGTQYKTGFKSLVFGMTVRNLSREIKYEKEGFQLPLTFKIGISINALDFFPQIDASSHKLFISLDAVHPRSYPEYVSYGAEYVFMDLIALRFGYLLNREEYNMTAGFGIRSFGFALDYSYMPFDVFGNINRFTVRFSL